MITFAQRLLALRGATKQKIFAQELRINPNTLRAYEEGRSLPNQKVLERICVKYSVSPVWLLLGEGSVRPLELDRQKEAGADEGSASSAMCQRCLELYEKLVQAQGRENMLLKENADLKVEMARLSLSSTAGDVSAQANTA